LTNHISDEYARTVCRVGLGASCCKYICVGEDGFECHKLTSLKSTIDERAKSMAAKSDNCDGMPEEPEEKVVH